MVWDPGFETEGDRVGDAEGWEVSVTAGLQRYASFTSKAWGVERFETGWGNDDFVWSLTDLILEYAEFGTDDDLYENFEWYSVLDDWSEVTGEWAVFDGAMAEEYENFEDNWDNDDDLHDLTSYILGTATENFTITGTAYKCRIKLVGASTFDATLTLPIQTYTASTLAAQLQSLVNTALIAQGAPFGSGDILFQNLDGYEDRVAVVNNKSGYKMTVYTGLEDGWGTVLGWTPGRFDFRFYESDVLEDAAIQWTGQYNSQTFDEEQFERGFGNDETREHVWTLDPWIDGSVVEPSGGFVISLGVNDQGSLRYREWGTANLTTVTLTIPAATYTATTLAAAINTALNTWLGGAGAPFSPGQIQCSATTDDRIRITNWGVSPKLMVSFITDTAVSLWDYIGMKYDDSSHVEHYQHSATARWPVYLTIDYATFDTSPEFYEDFEEDWP